MKIIEYTTTKLSIQQNDSVKHWIVGMIFIIIGAIAIAGPQQVTNLTCDRTNSAQGSCELVHSSLLLSDTTTIPLENLQEAKIQVQQNSSEESYRIVLVTKSEQISLMSDYSSDLDNQEMMAIEINEFIQNSDRPSLRIQEDRRLFSYLFGGLFILAGLVGSGLMTQQSTYHFDKSIGCVTFTKRILLWKKISKKSLAELLGLQVEPDRKNQEENTYRISLVLTSGKCLRLGSAYELSREETEKLIDCMTTFLNIDVTNHW